MESQTEQSFPIKKFILFAVLSFVFLYGWNYVFPPANQEVNQQHVEKQGDSKNNEGSEHAPPAQQTAESTPPPVQPAQIFPERRDKLSIDGADAYLSSKGGKLVSIKITNPKRFEAAGDLLGSFPKDSNYFPFGVKLENGIVAIPVDYVFQVVENESIKNESGYSKIVYRYTDPANRFVFDKIFETKADSPYQFNLSVRLQNKMANAPLNETISLSIYGYEDPNVSHSFLETRADHIEGLCKLEDDLERKAFNKVDKPELFNSATIWNAIDQRYFVFAAIPTNLGTQCRISKVDDHYLRTTIEQKPLNIKPNESATLQWLVYSGPKNFDILTNVGHELRETVDFGMLSFIARPLRWMLSKIHDVVGNWGLAIIVLTIVIRLLLWPLNQIAYSQTEKMRRLQPKINEIKEKYKGDAQKIQEEQLRLMKESGTTPLGCLPMFLQFPILLALYFMILNSVELYHAHFILWYTNLAARDPYFVLPILMGITMFLQQHFMTPEMDPNNPAASMQKIMKFMPIMFTAFMLFLPSGVVLYYFVSLLIGLGQQWYIRESLAKKYAAIDAKEAEKSSK